MKRLWLVVLLAFASCSAATSATRLTYVDLVKRLTDLQALAVLPEKGETCAQWASWDRASIYDEATGKYVKWDANGDGHGVIRAEGDQVVMAEIDGPGCIWRIWSATPKDGRVRIYLDGAAEPAVDLPFRGYFDKSSAPFVYPSLVHVTASGWNNYVPIPFRKSCKIVADKGWGDYYHFTYSTFPKGTVVPTFTRNLSIRETAALEEADRLLTTGLGSDMDRMLASGASGASEVTESRSISLPPGRTAAVAQLQGPRAITAIRVDPGTLANEWDALRSLVLRIRWDDEKNPSVWAPLGDFFGTAPGINLYKSLPLGMTEQGFYSYWYMPFEKRAVVEIVNDGAVRVPLKVSISHAPLTRSIKSLGRFHAKWHRDAFLPAEPERWIDWPMLKTRGRGRFCGVNLHVFNPGGGWWGEGDEKFFVDGEKFPSTFGTGSEDYFGYAWCNPTLFYNAYHNQPYNQNSNAGSISVNRWHIADNVPFHTSFDGYIEKYYLNDRPTLYACTSYWYQAPGGDDPYGPVPVSERVGYYTYEVYMVKGAIEGEKLKVLSKTGGQTSSQGLGDFGGKWSQGTHLWWTEGQPGNTLELALPVKNAGKYALKAQLTKARDYGIVQLYLNGKKLGEPIDLFNPEVVPTGEISLGTFDLPAGESKLSVEILGANENAVKSYMCGIDYVKLDAAQ